MKKLTENDIRDVAIRITDKLVELGYIPDCIDTDDYYESEVQHIIFYHIVNSLQQVSSRTPQN